MSSRVETHAIHANSQPSLIQGFPVTVANRIMGYRVFESKNRYAIINGATDTM
jgi:hypothetical protein